MALSLCRSLCGEPLSFSTRSRGSCLGGLDPQALLSLGVGLSSGFFSRTRSDSLSRGSSSGLLSLSSSQLASMLTTSHLRSLSCSG